MLKITIHENSGMTTIQLEGKLVGPWVDELNRVWSSLLGSTSARKLEIDLRDIAFVDANGKKLLQEIYQMASVRFLTASPLTRHFAEEAMRKSQKYKEGEI
jgi:ABC-type transporter Mla MlaB component